MPFFLAVLSYLFGSIPTGYLLVKIKEKKDIRSFGSQSIGATNILRTQGLGLALIVLFLDIMKGLIPALLTRNFISDLPVGLLISFGAVAGHCFPITISFRGGKGVATSVGVMAVYGWPALLASAAVFLLVVFLTRFVSLGSLLASLSFIPFMYLFSHNLKLTAGACLFTLLIWFSHRYNLKRLARKTEPRLGEKIKPAREIK